MSTITNTRNLLLIIAVLLITNISVLAYFGWFRKEQDKQHGPNVKELLKKDVKFTAEQLEHYSTLKQRQRDIAKPMWESMRKSKDSLFSLLSDDTITDSTVEKITAGISQKQQALDQMSFRHYRALRAICEPSQLPAYDSMLVRLFRKPNSGKKEETKK